MDFLYYFFPRDFITFSCNYDYCVSGILEVILNNFAVEKLNSCFEDKVWGFSFLASLSFDDNYEKVFVASFVHFGYHIWSAFVATTVEVDTSVGYGLIAEDVGGFFEEAEFVGVVEVFGFPFVGGSGGLGVGGGGELDEDIGVID